MRPSLSSITMRPMMMILNTHTHNKSLTQALCLCACFYCNCYRCCCFSFLFANASSCPYIYIFPNSHFLCFVSFIFFSVLVSSQFLFCVIYFIVVFMLQHTHTRTHTHRGKQTNKYTHTLNFLRIYLFFFLQLTNILYACFDFYLFVFYILKLFLDFHRKKQQ